MCCGVDTERDNSNGNGIGKLEMTVRSEVSDCTVRHHCRLALFLWSLFFSDCLSSSYCIIQRQAAKSSFRANQAFTFPFPSERQVSCSVILFFLPNVSYRTSLSLSLLPHQSLYVCMYVTLYLGLSTLSPKSRHKSEIPSATSV